MQMTVAETAQGPLTIRMEGRLDVAGVDAVEPRFAKLADPAERSLVVDMSGVVFVASLGIRMFVAAARRLVAAGHKLVLHSCQPAVGDVFEMAALDELITIAPNLEAAHARLS